MKLLVIGFAKIAKEVTRPGTAIAAAGIKPGIEPQSLARQNLNQVLAGLQWGKIGIVLNTRQFEPVNFLVLTKQGIVRRTKHRIPGHPPQMGPAQTGMPDVPRRDIPMQPKSLTAHCHHQQECKYDSSLCLFSHEVVSSLLCLP